MPRVRVLLGLQPLTTTAYLLRVRGKTMMLPHFRGDILVIWIPAFAGMTQFLLMDYLGLMSGNH